MEKTVLLADDHIAIRIGLRLLCDMHLGIKNIDEVSRCGEIILSLKKKSYSHLILDISLSEESTLEMIPTIRELYPKLCIVIYSMQSERVHKKHLASYGINFISKSLSEKEAIQKLKDFFNNWPNTSQNKHIGRGDSIFDFSPRESEVYQYLIKGFQVKRIAQHLNLSPSTISTIKLRIFEKCSVDNIVGLKELNDLHGF